MVADNGDPFSSMQKTLCSIPGLPRLPPDVSFEGFRFANYGSLCKLLDSATVAKYEDVNLADQQQDKFGNQVVHVTRCSNIAEVLVDRMDFARFHGPPGEVQCEIDFEAVRPPPQKVGSPADGCEFRDAEDFFNGHHAQRRAQDSSLPARCIVLPYGLWSDGVQMSRWSGASLHPVCLYVMSYREVIRFTHENIVRLGYIPGVVHPRNVSQRGHQSHQWSVDKWAQVTCLTSIAYE